ncbi:BTAD domain-containing putative transcriptional regulator [Streptomyces sp. V4I2]|uniref:AfsR/SARP family transcriptional regulator n=1 Tax=Streptomyces sp. V4I2 TaxID=3042280 RepID=UPI00277E0473|nr:BTAD domain-containing putative transcriptional regulator [Streptomyces sp. V4I2]MDQ1051839.1 DNA-binding SARP family transcriptional activator [Streptomyces sp. V4I2]
MRLAHADGTVVHVHGNEASAEVSLELLGAFELTCCGSRVPAPLGAQRLLAFLGLRPDGVHRSAAAEQLWPDYPCHRAAANLRSALCQGRRACCVTLIDCIGQRLRVSPVVRVDVLRKRDSARQIVDGPAPPPADSETLIEQFTRELLPGWPDEWLHPDRERWDQIRLYALEGLAQRLLTAQQYLPALQAALAATAIDPIRETAHRTVIEIHLAEGNVASAVRCYQQYRAYLQRELGVSPSTLMTDLLQGQPCLQGDRHRKQLSAPAQAAARASDRLRGQAIDSRAPRRDRNAF